MNALQCRGAVLGFAGAVVISLCLSPVSHAGTGWVAVASSPSHEQLDWAYGPNQASAEARALIQCERLQRAADCIVLASSPDCVAVVWDGAEPLNRAHGASGGEPQVVLQAAVRAAGQYANDPLVRCTWS